MYYTGHTVPVYSVHSTLYTVHCTSVQCTLYTVFCALSQCTVYTLHCILCTVPVYSAHSTLYTVFCTLYQCTVYNAAELYIHVFTDLFNQSLMSRLSLKPSYIALQLDQKLDNLDICTRSLLFLCPGSCT